MAAQRTSADALADALAARSGAPVERIETRISWIFLTGRLAFKLKKPVRLGFLDFTGVAARRAACEAELRLNRRFSDTIYRRVIAVRGTPLAPRIGGAGAPIDWLVCMRRFPRGALLSERIEAGSLTGECVERVARCIAAFHARASVAGPATPFGAPGQPLQAAHAVLAALDAEDARVAALRAWIEAQGVALADTWRARRQAGFVRDCHGDLHAANVACLGDRVVPFDCLEFDPALRWTDVMGDVGFLAMDLAARDRPDLAFRFLDAWLAATGDFDGVGVLRFQLVYRALVRAMAEAGDAPAAASGYLDGALAWSAGAAPRLLIAHGLSGSGKSSVALQLLQHAGAIRLRSDVERKRLFGLEPLARATPDRVDLYSADASRRVHERLLAGARAVLRGGFPAIVDATFLRAADRAAFRQLAREEGVAFAILDCRADAATLRERIVARQERGADPSDATLAVLAQQRATDEPLDPAERACAIEVDTGAAPDVAEIVRRWRALPPA